MSDRVVAILFFGAFLLGIGGLFATMPAPVSKEESKNELKIVASNWKFDKEKYEVAVGSTLDVILENKQGIHGIEVEGLDLQLQGDTLSKKVTFDKPGEYKVICIVLCGEGHVTMVSTIVVS